MYSGVSTSELDELASQTAASLTSTHPDYAQLAARIAISNLHKNTSASFSENVKLMYDNVNPRNNLKAPLVAENFYEAVMANAQRLDDVIDYERDYDYDYFGFKVE